MMLTAIPRNSSSSVFAHNHTPSGTTSSSHSQPGSPDSVVQSQSSAHVLRGMNTKASTGSSTTTPDHTNEQGHPPPQLIPMTAVHQPFILGAGGAGYTLVPSLSPFGNVSGNDATMFGIQPLGTVSALPRHRATVQQLAAVPSSYYSRIQQSDNLSVGFQQPHQQAHQQPNQQPNQQLTAISSSQSRHLGTARSPTITQPLPPPHTLLISSTGTGLVMNGNQTANMELKSCTVMQPINPDVDPGVIHGEKTSVLSPPSLSSQSSLQEQGTSSLDKATSSSDSDIHHQSDHGRRRSSHSYSRSRATHHASRSSSNTLDTKIGKSVLVKCEPVGDDPLFIPATTPPSHPVTSIHFVTTPPSINPSTTPPTILPSTAPPTILPSTAPPTIHPTTTHPTIHPATTRRNSDSTLEESMAGSSSKGYQISALIDVPPMAPPLNRASRTSSLSSSLSSFRFGGSLSQLWASQISLSGKINNMKSTGNLNADAAIMPSLGNQYFAFGGSLPELSLTSLTRLLPNSSANDPGISSCPGLFTLPLYVYPSQQHLGTPFINTNGSITFGSFLSSGSSLCSTSKGPLGSGGSSGTVNDGLSVCDSDNNSGQANNPDITTNNDTNAEERLDGCAQVSGPSPSSSLHESVIKLPMYASQGPLLAGPTPSVITSLPAFNTLTHGLESDTSNSNSVTSLANISPSHSNLPPPMTVSRSSSLSNQNLNPMGSCIVATNDIRLHPQGISSGDPTPHCSSIPHSHLHGATSECSSEEQPHPIVQTQSEFYVTGGDSSMLQTVPITNINRIKMESDSESMDQSPAHGLPLMSPESAHLHNNMELVQVGGKGVKKEKDKPYKCDHPGCGRSFSFPAHLRSHIQQIHISYRPCKCEFPGCGKRFYTPQHLNVHRRVHTGERPFVCPYAECSKAFTTAGNLKNHIRTHTGERPYACKFEGCNKRFAEMSSLKKHELTHTGEKPYKCRVCGKAFSQAGSRNTHERKHSRTEEDQGGRVNLGVGGSGAKGTKKYRIKRISGNGSVEEQIPQ